MASVCWFGCFRLQSPIQAASPDLPCKCGQGRGRVEGDGVELGEAGVGEDRAVLGAGDVVAGLAAELHQEPFRVGVLLAGFAGDDGVGKAAGPAYNPLALQRHATTPDARENQPHGQRF